MKKRESYSKVKHSYQSSECYHFHITGIRMFRKSRDLHMICSVIFFSGWLVANVQPGTGTTWR
jgi:hypothetical protein